MVIRGRAKMVVIRGGAKEMVLMGAKMLVIWGGYGGNQRRGEGNGLVQGKGR